MKELSLPFCSFQNIQNKKLKHNRNYKSIKLIILLFLLSNSLIFPLAKYLPQETDTLKEKPVQYRRGVELKEGYQTYNEKYAGKNLNEEKRRLFPLRDGTGVWTELNPKVPRVDYLGVHFINKDTGWAVGDLGALIKTTDGGNSWTVSETNTTTPILKVRSYNGQVVIASGFDGLILRSSDGGESFEQITSNVTGDLWGLQMINDTLGWACGNANSLTKTIDGGQTWQKVITPGYTSDYWWIDFMPALLGNENYGFIAANGKVLKTIDGGENWEIIQAGDDFPLFSIDVIDNLHIAAAGYGATKYFAKNIYSNDGGYTWINGDTLTTESVNCIQYVNPDTGYLVMTNVSARKTTNRGQEWTTVQGISDNYELQFLEKLNERIGYSAGTGLQLNKAEGNLDVWKKLIINDNFADVYFISEQKGFAISDILYRTTDGGNNWEPNGPGGSSVIFIDSMSGFIGNPGFIWKTLDGGNNWYTTNGSNGASKIFFASDKTGWAIRNNVIYKTTDSGENWFIKFTAPLSILLTSIYFVDSLYGWTANLGGRPYKTTNSGENWVQQTNIDIWESRDVLFKDYLNGFILESNKFYTTSDGGINWVLNPEITGFSVAAKFSHFNNNTIFIIGYKTYRSIDGGLNWLDFIELTGLRVNGLNLLGMGFGFAVGELGLVLKYYDEDVPVELVSFTTKLEGNKVILKWSTASEINNQGFYVQRRKESEIDWENLVFINGSGTSTNINLYNYEHELNQFGKYKYRLKQVDYNGKYEYSDETEVEFLTENDFHLFQNFPNPFNPLTKINFILKVDSKVTLKVFDILGEEIVSLVNKNLVAGYYNIEFNASDYPSGIYFLKMKADGINGEIFESTKKMILVK